MFIREAQKTFSLLKKEYPVVTITGPRQSGKTTLAKDQNPDSLYFNLENPSTRERISSDPNAFFSTLDLTKGVILDEIQVMPELLSYIQVIVDEKRVPGAFILTGSHQLALSESIAQSLAGRTGILELLPLNLPELEQGQTEASLDDILISGCFPGIYEHTINPNRFMQNYTRTYVERDVRKMLNVKNLNTFQRFLKLVAGRIGSTTNYESLSNDVGTSQKTIKQWISILQASYIAYELPPFFENFGKRIIKASKLYFYDVGLASYLLDIHDATQMAHDRLRGALFENLVLTEILKYEYNRSIAAKPYFFRDSNQNEVDIILQYRGKLIPIEVKATTTFNRALIKNLRYFQGLLGNNANTAYLVYAGEEQFSLGSIEVINYRHIDKIFNNP